MPAWKDYVQYFKDFFDTLAGKLTAILAFALLVIIALGWFGASIPADYKWLVYIVVILAMLIFSGQAESESRPTAQWKFGVAKLPVSPATNQYALACFFIEMLAGLQLFHGL